MWNADRDQTVIRMWQQGASASAIARQIVAVSRSAVLGRIHRLRQRGLKLEPRQHPRGLSKSSKHREAREKYRTLAPIRRVLVDRARPYGTQPPKPIIEDTSETPARRLLDLEIYECRWPIGDPRSPEFGFCGCKTRQPYGYCEKHRARAYVERAA